MNGADKALADVHRWLCDNLSDGDAGKVCGMLSVVSRRIGKLEEENDKLRELCSGLYEKYWDLTFTIIDPEIHAIEEKLRELGIEV